MSIYRNSGKYGPDGMLLNGNFVKIVFRPGYILAWKLRQAHIQCHRRDLDRHLSVFVPFGGPSCSSALYFLSLEYIFLSVGIPYGGSILQVGT